jgi:hypothetical protein
VAGVRNLSEKERSLIKALVARPSYNDQVVLSYFSFPGRTLNHRVVAQIRQGKRPYDGIQPASEPEVQEFLASYGHLERVAKELALQVPEEHFQLVQKSREAISAAVSVYNNPLIQWKSEIFIVNCVIAWMYALHAYYKRAGIDYRYKANGTVQKTPDGRDRYWELSRCLDVAECPLSEPAKANLRYIIAIRNEVEHRISDNIDRFIEAKLQASALNLENFLTKQFGAAFGVAGALGAAIQMAALRPEQVEALKRAATPAVVKAANAALEQPLSNETLNSPEYAYRVWLVPRIVNHKNQADYVGQYAPTGAELTIKEVEKKKYLPGQIVRAMKAEGAKKFKMADFVKIWQTQDGKNAKHKLGVMVAGHWYWYEAMVTIVRQKLIERGDIPAPSE